MSKPPSDGFDRAIFLYPPNHSVARIGNNHAYRGRRLPSLLTHKLLGHRLRFKGNSTWRVESRFLSLTVGESGFACHASYCLNHSRHKIDPANRVIARVHHP